MRILTVGVLLCALASPLAAQQAGDMRRQITVMGEAEITAVPDIAVVSLGVVKEAAEAEAAMAAANQAVAAVLERLTSLGIAARDIQTSGLSLYPRYVPVPEQNAPPRIDGFTASNMLTVRVRDLADLGEVLGAVVQDGANRFDGVSFTLDDTGPLLDEARRQAVADARARAELLTVAARVKLGEVLSISEMHMGGGPEPKMMEMAMARDSSVPVAPGEVTLSAQVTIVYAID